MELIDKAAVVAEIKRIEYETNYKPFTDEVIGERNICRKIRQVLDTLEVKEVDLEEKLFKWLCDNCDDAGYFNRLELAKYFFELGLKTQKGE